MAKKINHVISIEQVNVPSKEERFQVSSSTKVAIYLTELIGRKTTEHVVILALNVQNEVVASYIPFIGTLSECIVQPREIFQFLLLNNASRFIFAHNHPSGHIEPSSEDLQVHHRLLEVGKIMSVTLLDSMIVSDNDLNYYSFRENNIKF